MNPAIAKTLSLILLIGVGFCLRRALPRPEHHQALKVLILNLALPAIIFVALMNSQMERALLWLPLGAIAFNFGLLALTWLVLPQLYGIRRESSEMRTLMLLIPSLAPGLSCFPFLLTYLGKEMLAHASIADLGNKVYVLIFCYLLAMQWHFRRVPGEAVGGWGRLRVVVGSLVREPVNMAIFMAMVLLVAGIHFQQLPAFAGDTITMLSAMMTPLVLLFIGLTVQFSWSQFRVIISLLLFRAAIALLFSTVCLSLIPELNSAMRMLVVVFPQSAVSFWPLAHISTISAMERRSGTSFGGVKTFNAQLALNVLAVSLPFSAGVSLTVFSTGDLFTRVPALFLTAGLLLVMAVAPVLVYRALKAREVLIS